MTPNGDAERWRLAGLPGARGIAAWADILAVTHLAFDVRATYRTPGTFQGTVTRRRFGELALVDCAASPFLGDRSLAVMGDHPEEIIGFQFVRKGVELVRESRPRDRADGGRRRASGTACSRRRSRSSSPSSSGP